MERRRSDRAPSSETGDTRAREPNYRSRIVQGALEHLASIDLIELCNEAKIERCRAIRDLSSCGRCVQHVLNSCGHAALCAECSQRCDVCPICRTSIPNNGNRSRLRLYYKCIEASLISKRHDDRFQGKEDSREHLMADIQRLYSLFDVALENNLVSLICHYVTDVCMDENAVSSDPVLAFLLDEVVVKDWCKQTFKKIIYDLRGKYSLGVEEMASDLCLFQKLSLQLGGISSVLEVMVSSFKETISAQLHDLHHLLENVLKAKQHLEVMAWCTRHRFLENVQSFYPNPTSWTLHVCERKSAAVKRAWPDISGYSEDSAGPHGSTLFIEQALSNLGIEQSSTEEREEVDISCLKDRNSPLFFRSKIDETHKNEGVASYPFETVRAATDILFLHGTSDMVVAKRAIFLYYLFDRHWTRSDVEWRHLVDDFAASFGISRHSLLESLVFFLLDDHTDRAVQEASHLLSEIAGPETHPKIAQVLLERQSPDVALTVLRCSGRDDRLPCISFSEAVTAIRVRIECGLLTEAFMYQQMYCSKAKEVMSKNGSSASVSDSCKSDSWVHQVEVLVTEICHLCIRRNLVDRMIELPWNSDEEKYLHRCLFLHVCQNPATIYGSLLVVFYLQRYRYIEAYQVDRILQSLEQSFSESANEDIVCRIKSISQWRAGLVGNGLDLLPEGQRRLVIAGSTAEDGLPFPLDVQMPSESDLTNLLPSPATLLTPSTKTSAILQKNFKSFPSRRSLADAPTNLSSNVSNAQLESGNKAPSVLQSKLLASLGSPTRLNSVVDGISYSNPHNGDISPSDIISRDRRRPEVRRAVGLSLPASFQYGPQSILPKEMKASPSKVVHIDHRFQVEKDFYVVRPNDSASHAENSHLHIPRITFEDQSNRMDTSYSNGFSKESIHDQSPTTSAKQNLLDRPWSRFSSEETNLNTQSFSKGDSHVEDSSMRVGSRWRSDESSEDEVDNGLDRHRNGGIFFSARRRARSSRR